MLTVVSLTCLVYLDLNLINRLVLHYTFSVTYKWCVTLLNLERTAPLLNMRYDIVDDISSRRSSRSFECSILQFINDSVTSSSSIEASNGSHGSASCESCEVTPERFRFQSESTSFYRSRFQSNPKSVNRFVLSSSVSASRNSVTKAAPYSQRSILRHPGDHIMHHYPTFRYCDQIFTFAVK